MRSRRTTLIALLTIFALSARAQESRRLSDSEALNESFWRAWRRTKESKSWNALVGVAGLVNRVKAAIAQAAANKRQSVMRITFDAAEDAAHAKDAMSKFVSEHDAENAAAIALAVRATSGPGDKSGPRGFVPVEGESVGCFAP